MPLPLLLLLPLLLPLLLRLPFLLSSRRDLLLPLPLLLFSLNQPKSLGAPSSARHYAPKVGMHTVNQPALAVVLVLAIAFVLAVACSLSNPHNKRHLDRRRRTLPPQWRDPCISSLPLPLPLLLSLSLLTQPKYAWVPHLRRG